MRVACHRQTEKHGDQVVVVKQDLLRLQIRLAAEQCCGMLTGLTYAERNPEKELWSGHEMVRTYFWNVARFVHLEAQVNILGLHLGQSAERVSTEHWKVGQGSICWTVVVQTEVWGGCSVARELKVG